MKRKLFYCNHILSYSSTEFCRPPLTICFNESPGKAAPGFGIGALEDLDAEDEDIYDSG